MVSAAGEAEKVGVVTAYFFLSGEHRTLPFAELKAIAEGEGLRLEVLAKLDQAVIARCDVGLFEALRRRSSLVKFGGILLGVTEVSDGSSALADAISTSASEVGGAPPFGRLSFKRVKRYGKGVISYSDVVNALGKYVAGGEGPVLDIIVTEGVVIAGVRMFERNIRDLEKRSPQLRPVYLPGTMTPLWCRVFVNLSRAGPKRPFIDPFCGVGGFLIEACFMGLKYFGSDISWKHVSGARTNLLYYGCVPAVAVADARHPPLREAVAIGTDPPYGRMTRAGGTNDLRELMRDFLSSIAELMRPGAYLAFAQRQDLDVESLVRDAGLRIVERHMNWVHGSLTRDIFVVIKP